MERGEVEAQDRSGQNVAGVTSNDRGQQKHKVKGIQLDRI